MPTPEIINYVRQQIASGIPRDQISASLKQNGWNDLDIAEAFKASAISANTAEKSSLKYRAAIVAALVLAVGIGVLFFLQKRGNNPVPQSQIQESAKDDFKINYAAVPADENSANIFEAIGINAISNDDKDLLNKYFNNFSSANPPPLVESKEILLKYKNILTAFETGVGKKYYQCSLVMGDKCSLSILRDVAKLAILNSFVLFKEGKSDDAQNYASKVVKLGQMTSGQAGDFINLLTAWATQKLAYNMLDLVKSGSILSDVEKNILINNLREEHKKVFRFIYTMRIETIDYITDANKKPSGVIDIDTEDIFNQYRTMANNVTWKPDEVKKWFYDSLKIELSNVDLICGSELKESQLDIGFNPTDTPLKENFAPNFVGKMLYTTTYASLNTTNQKRCEIENLITAL